MNERVKLVGAYDANLMTMVALSSKLGVSRKTAYKWVKRFREEGASGLFDRLRIAKRQPSRTATTIEVRLIKFK
jgi:transposase